MSLTDVSTCRSCGAAEPRLIADLGETPIANALVNPVDAPTTDRKYPLAIVVCSRCWLVQLADALPADAMFDAKYPYFSSFSDELVQHAKTHVDHLVSSRGLHPGAFAVEIASNDGYLLQHFGRHGVRALGVDPSPGPAEAARSKGISTLTEFFGTKMAHAMVDEHGHADVVVANNVMAHVPELNDFVGGLATLLADDGVLTVENPSVRELIDNAQFDQVYHEHYSYFSTTAVAELFKRHGLFLNDVEFFPKLHGGTLRWWAGKQEQRTERCAAHLADENAHGIRTVAYYQSLAERIPACGEALRTMLAEYRSNGLRVAAYGAAAKGATLLNVLGLDATDLEYVVDRNPHKQNKLMPGCRIPIRPVEVLLDDKPDVLLLLAWNFADEIMRQQEQYASAGGRFIVPVPIAHEVSTAPVR